MVPKEFSVKPTAAISLPLIDISSESFTMEHFKPIIIKSSPSPLKEPFHSPVCDAEKGNNMAENEDKLQHSEPLKMQLRELTTENVSHPVEIPSEKALELLGT